MVTECVEAKILRTATTARKYFIFKFQ